MEKFYTDETSQETDKQRKKRLEWTSEQEGVLFSLWESHFDVLKTKGTSRFAYLSMEEAFHKNGFDDINVEKIKIKMNNLKQKYQ